MVIKNFLFHRVDPGKDPFWPPMSPELFEKTIAWITRHYQVVELEEYSRYHQKVKASKPWAAISFDDGYKDNIIYAAPILQKYHCPASFYVVTDCIIRNVPTWTYAVDYLLQQTNAPAIVFDFDFVPPHLKRIDLKIRPNAIALLLKPWMKTLPNRDRLQVLQSLELQCADCQVPSSMMMSWGDLEQLHSAGFTIGSHTHTHPVLARLESHAEIDDELRTSYNEIYNHLQLKPQAVSYPFGSFNENVLRIAEQIGYNCGVAVKQRFFNTDADNPFEIPRVELYQEPWWKMKGRMNGVYNSVQQLWKKVKI